MELSAAQFTALIGQVWWPFFRISAALMLMPIFGGSQIPVQVRIALSLIISVLAAPLMPTMPAVDPLSVEALILAGQQVIIGAMLALLLDLLFAIFTTMGQILSMQMGLGMAMMNDPINGVSIPALGKYYQLYALMLFLALDGHLVALDVMVQSFNIWPVGEMMSQMALHTIIMRFGWMMAAALLLSLPAVCAMLLVNGSFGMMNRAAPQLNVFALGFPMTMLLGLICLLITTSGIPENFTRLSSETLSLMLTLEEAHP
ncbi:flagellar biosynthetic protein FliR [Photobacterium sanguinicancri]|uniref:Flagellar biosynthetic protein FliR n=1 Tax=Photobacterium sanguinicancri TaxID=875932 RepID=A0AAW7YAL1_9GAMM|nr:flagellar biosynthetic protein FliR [Photobacterium sanguinicancri]MDO6500162.1 flagellar biosynthetic protein FliR [Photobacterium sanguinicancri]MDO6543814.1 flagellar biosynthetic protein FliR [Photobacterium sanguinicancri]